MLVLAQLVPAKALLNLLAHKGVASWANNGLQGAISDAAIPLVFILPNNPVRLVGSTVGAGRSPDGSRTRDSSSRNWNRSTKTPQVLAYESAEIHFGEPLAGGIQARRLAKLRWARRCRATAGSCAPGSGSISPVFRGLVLPLSRASRDECSTENSGRPSTGYRPGTGCLEGCGCGRRRRS
jgi:hypothetical protein